MSDIAEQIEKIEKEIRDTPYHKGTEHHIGKLRARLARLRDSVEEQESRRAGGGKGYAVRKQGDATVVLVGPPSAGKSTLLNHLTNAQSKVAPYAFTTVTVIPGMMTYKNARIQILDVPGLIENAEEGKGRGREVLSVVRAADIVIIMTDVDRPEAADRITWTLEKNGIRLNKTHPKVKIEKKLSGGLNIRSNIRQEFGEKTAKEVARELGVKNAEISINEKITLEGFVDAFSKNRVYIPALYAINKVDDRQARLDFNDLNHHYMALSAKNGIGLNELKDKIWEMLGLAVVYLVRPDEDPHKNSPIVIKKGDTLWKVANTIGSEFSGSKTEAKIWGAGAKFPGQEVSLSTVAQDGMMVRFL